MTVASLLARPYGRGSETHCFFENKSVSLNPEKDFFVLLPLHRFYLHLSFECAPFSVTIARRRHYVLRKRHPSSFFRPLMKGACVHPCEVSIFSGATHTVVLNVLRSWLEYLILETFLC